MPKLVRAGSYYEFNRWREHYEVASEIPWPWAISRLRRGHDVYTPRRARAAKLARKAYPTTPVEDPPHQRDFFAHFHPGDRVEGFGHVFFNIRGEGYVPDPP